MRAREGLGQALYLNVLDDLSTKKSSLQKIFGSNLFLKNRRVEFIPTTQYASLREARENFDITHSIQLLASSYESTRTYFARNLS